MTTVSSRRRFWLSPTTRLIAVQLVVFAVGFLWLASFHIYGLDRVDALDRINDNEEARLAIAEQVNLQLVAIESGFYELATRTSERRHEALKEKILEEIADTRQLLRILDEGGTYVRVIDVNLEFTEKVTFPVEYRPDESRSDYVLEVIDLMPKLDEVEGRLDALFGLLAARETHRLDHDPTEYLASIRAIRDFLKKVPPLFTRMRENANRIHASSTLRFFEIEREFRTQKEDYRRIELIIAVLTLLAVTIIGFFIGWRIRRTNQALREATRVAETSRAAAEEARRHNVVINRFLEAALQPVTLNEVLETVLEEILSVPWLAVRSQGSIFLADPDSRELELAAQHQLPPELQVACARLQYGQCLCGRVAETRHTVFSSHADDAHSISYEDMPGHGHICLPIQSQNRLLGVLNLYVKDGLERNEVHEEFLFAATRALATVIERKRNEEMLRKLFQAVDQSPSTVLITDDKARIEYANPVFTQTTGYSVDEVLGKSPRILKSGHTSPEQYAELWRTLTAGQTWRGEFLTRRKDGSHFWESAAISPVLTADGRTTHYVAVKEDMSRRKQIESELMRASRAAQEANRAKSEFLANMSHEIRTPMNAVIGLGHLVLDTELNPEQRDYIGKILSSAETLLNLINDILDFSKVEAGHLTLEAIPFDLDDALRPALVAAEVGAQQKGLTVRAHRASDVPTGLVGDPFRLGQILTNLLNNAVKFTDTGGVELLMEVVDRRPDAATIRFSVTDTGIGIPQERIDRLFRAFSQADSSTTRRFGGTGLGLAISQQLVAMMDGKLEVSSVPGQGSTFTFTTRMGIAEADEHEVTARDAREPGDTSGAATRERSAPRRVLVAEDTPLNQVVIRGLLTRLGARVAVVNNGQEALEELEQQPFDIVFLDLQMPVMDGYETARAIRANPKWAALPVIALTAHAMNEEKDRCLAAGMDGHLAKPVTPTALSAALDTWTHRTANPQRGGSPRAVTTRRLRPVQVPPVNHAAAMERLGDDPDLYSFTMRAFVRTQANAMAEVANCLAAGNADAAKRRAHSLRGVALHIGADPLAEVLLQLELQIGKNHDTARLVEEARDLHAETLAAVNTSIGNDATA